MNQPPQIRIYLADRRRVVRTETHQALFTIPLKVDADEDSFENLNMFCEITQKPETVIRHTCSTSGVLFVLPLVGKVVIHGLKDETTIDAGQLLQAGVANGQHLDFKNPYESEWISYLIWEINTELKLNTDLTDFDIEASMGALVDILTNTDQSIPISVQAGLFDGRQDASLTHPASQHEFIFVVEGAFEVQNRLLHARDALSLPCCQSIEFEALSNKATILILSF